MVVVGRLVGFVRVHLVYVRYNILLRGWIIWIRGGGGNVIYFITLSALEVILFFIKIKNYGSKISGSKTKNK